MITSDDIVNITLDKEHITEIIEQSTLSCIGGSSNARTGNRQQTLKEDQISGHACHMAASIYLYGSIDPYLQQRCEANAHPYKGDGGSDFLGTKIDVKGGNKRKSKGMSEYNLIVPQSEYHRDYYYISALTKFNPSKILNQDELQVCLLGWVLGSSLFPQIFFGKEKYMVQNIYLEPLQNLPQIAYKALVKGEKV